ncbi:hypothetical protein Tco_0618872, partial [Tanacetum coccineum]
VLDCGCFAAETLNETLIKGFHICDLMEVDCMLGYYMSKKYDRAAKVKIIDGIFSWDGWTCTGHGDTSMVMVVHPAGLDPNIALGLDKNDTIIVGMKDGTNHEINKTNLKQIIPNMAAANTCLGKFVSREIIASGWGIEGLLPLNATIIYVITLHKDTDLGCSSHVIA